MVLFDVLEQFLWLVNLHEKSLFSRRVSVAMVSFRRINNGVFKRFCGLSAIVVICALRIDQALGLPLWLDKAFGLEEFESLCSLGSRR